MKFHWRLDPPQPVLAGQLGRDLHVSPIIGQCLVNRGLSNLDEAGYFLSPRLKNLADPFLINGMSRAVDRLFQARDASEPVVIFGDYDVDGVTSTVLLIETLTALGWEVQHYLPHRRDEGYGLTMDAVATCIERFPTRLLLAVDCGSSSPETVDWLGRKGVDVIILDHHQGSSPLPKACALVNPHTQETLSGQPEGTPKITAFKELCSAGLAFKLAHAVVKRGRDRGVAAAAGFDVRALLDLVALGTIADVVPLVRENRILVSAGLERLAATSRPGLVALKQVSGCGSRMGAYEVGFQLGPRLNAAGRLETAEDALHVLRARDMAEAMPIAQRLNQQNQERQSIERGIVESVLSRVEAGFQSERDYVIIEGDPAWHIGVVGIVASRVLQRFHRPTIIFGGDGQHWRGSGRSIAGFDLAGALHNCGHLLVRHGGHAMAAGVTIEPANVDSFRDRLNEVAKAALAADALRPSLRLDCEVGLDEINHGLMISLDKLRPFGNANPAPHFMSRSLTHARPVQRMGNEKQHVKMWVTDGGATHEAVWWGAGAGALPVGTFDLAFEPGMNHYNGRSLPQLKVLDWRPTGKGAELEF